MRIIITENQISELRTVLNDIKIIYSAVFFDKSSLISKYPPIHENVYADHSTIEFKPKDITNLPIGDLVEIKITGRLTTNKFDILIVDNYLSTNKYPHITLSSIPGAVPSESNKEIETHLNDITKLNDKIYGQIGLFTNKGIIKDDILVEMKIPVINLSSFIPQKTLNPKIWVSENKINPKVRKRLLKIADDFIDYIKIDSDFHKDTLLLGSLANYNWSKYSDLDLHLLIDLSKINDDLDLVKDYVDSKRRLWNDEHDNLTIYGFPVEIYVQDINEQNASTSIYSLEKNKWLLVPDIETDSIIDKSKIKQKASDIMVKIDALNDQFINSDSDTLEIISEKVKKIFDEVKRLRKNGLNSPKGEYSTGNIVFKVLRRTKYIEKLVDLKRNTYDKINSIK